MVNLSYAGPVQSGANHSGCGRDSESKANS